MNATSGTGMTFVHAALISLASALLCAVAYAAQPAAVPRVGVLNPFPSSTLEEGILDGIHQAGYI